MARSRRSRDDDYDDDDDYDEYPERRAGDGGTDAPGVIGLVFGVVGMICLLLGCFTCGLTYYAAVPIALIGVGCSAFGRGNLRVAGLAINLLTLLPAIVIVGMIVFGAGVGVIAPPPQP